jgi:hypothetical protein
LNLFLLVIVVSSCIIIIFLLVFTFLASFSPTCFISNLAILHPWFFPLIAAVGLACSFSTPPLPFITINTLCIAWHARRWMQARKQGIPEKRIPTVCEGVASNVQHDLHGLRAHGLHVGPLGVAHNRLGKRGLRAVEPHAWSLVCSNDRVDRKDLHKSA